MSQRKIVVIYVDDEIKFLSSYSYLDDYRPHFGEKLDPKRIKISLTNDINSACQWETDCLLNTAYNILRVCILKDTDVKSDFRVNTNIFKRYLKIKNIKSKLERTDKI